MNYFKLILTLSFTIFTCYLAVAQRTKQSKTPENELVAIWQVIDTNNHPSVNPLFHYSNYENYREEGFLLINPNNPDPGYMPDIPARRSPSSSYTASLNLRNDGQFAAISSFHQLLPTDDIETWSFTWMGKWSQDKDTLSLQPRETATRGLTLSGLTSEVALNKTFRFIYRIEKNKLLLFPLFNKEDAYKMMLEEVARCKNERYWAKLLEYDILPVLSNSYSKLTAYTVQQVRERMAHMDTTTTDIQPDINFIQEIIEQWYKGKSGLPVAPLPKPTATVNKTNIQRKWYMNENPGKLIEVLISPGLYSPANIWVVPDSIPISIEYMQEYHTSLNLKSDETFIVRYSYARKDPKTELKGAMEYYGTWTLKDNKLILYTKEVQMSGHLGDKTVPIDRETITLVSMEGDKLYLGKGPLPYERMKAIIAEARKTKQYMPLCYILPSFSNIESPVSAYEAWQASKLWQKADRNKIMEGKQADTEQLCNLMESIIDKWYKEMDMK